MSFKFTGLDQLKALNISVPAQIYQEVAYRRNQIKENEARSAAMNNEKAFKKRPNFVPDFNKTQQSSYTAGYTQNQQISRYRLKSRMSRSNNIAPHTMKWTP